MKDNSSFFKNSTSFLLPLYFLIPYFAFLKFFSGSISMNGGELLWALKNSALQSSLASLICTGFGFLLACGLLTFPKKFQGSLLKLVLIPQILPSLFSILIAFSILNPFPMGHIGVIFIFILINLGFSAYQICIAIRNKMGHLALISEINGLKKNVFLRRVMFPLLWPDLKLNFFLVFLFCFSSLSIPLVAGGGHGTNLEVLIFEKIFIELNWDSAWILMLLQTGFVFLISFFFLKNQADVTSEFKMHSFYKSDFGGVVLIIYLLLFLGSYAVSFVTSVVAVDDLSSYSAEIWSAARNSLVLLFFVLLACFTLLILWIADYVQTLKHNIALNFISVSTVLVGFSFYVWFPQGVVFDLWKIPLAFSILFFPMLFKIFFEKKILQLQGQILAAKLFGISTRKIIFEVILNQCARVLFLSASLLAILSLSDFAISRALGAQTKTLGLLTANLLSSYRLDAAYLISGVILVIWVFVSLFIYHAVKGIYGVNKEY